MNEKTPNPAEKELPSLKNSSEVENGGEGEHLKLSWMGHFLLYSMLYWFSGPKLAVLNDPHFSSS